MANLSESDRAALWARYMAGCSRRRDVAPLSKSDLRAAVNALDVWLDANAAAVNAAIPQPARGALSSAQKAELLAGVVLQRFEKGA